ncbi:MAG: hypothetical protein CJD30_10640 [Sulfuricurvum sp. PD_MW2]|jgi:hypothetical protein|uniref:hypothetical protein n=1 Tax=Sulfuricurvum sp. PD_MW2 TaxID=2027917 RepID=UPI000C05FF32|nr:hypothetical protein [Sulfuricurvum sp. PD_MW2]PHM16607.1 MAG: hypothetical protein CJD30_10640 [Sulfuricurvum sp. PD_MW2]
MSLKLKGVLIGQYESVYTDKETSIPVVKQRIQVLIEKTVKNGSKSELVDLTIPTEKASKYAGMEGKQIEVDVSYFGQCTFFGI